DLAGEHSTCLPCAASRTLDLPLPLPSSRANAHWFMSLDDARQKCEAWRRDYNEERPHSAIGNKAPIELVDRSVAHGPPRSKPPGKNPAGRSKDGEQFTRRSDSNRNWIRIGGNVTGTQRNQRVSNPVG